MRIHASEDTTFDLRSDTVTTPTPQMRQAMIEAEVGDDVYREDPTAARLEARAATITGKDAALFMPTGTMGNQVALATWARRGTSVVCEARAHLLLYEQAAMSALSGLTPSILDGDATGCIHPDDIERALRPAPYYRISPGVVAVECTHNVAGGQLPPLDKLAAIYAHARDAEIPVHMDGARLFNAACALDVPVSEICAHTDSVTFCLSKGLGAPIGSVLCGPAEFIERALAVRKRFGGGMRQIGMLAAAGLYALEHHVDRLAQDHLHARQLAEGLAGVEGLSVDPDAFPTNIVYVDCAPVSGARWVEVLAERGVLINALGPERLRFVTHLDFPGDAVDVVLDRVADAAQVMHGSS